MSKKLFLFLAVILPMCLATAIYLLFRSEELVIFQILNKLNLSDIVFSMREAVSDFHPYHWFALSLPGSLWMCSSMNLLLMVWKFNIRKQNFLWIYSPFIFAIALEMIQKAEWTDGTFDGTDIIMYCCMTALFTTIYYVKRNSFPKIQIKKNMHWQSLSYMLLLFSVVYCSDKITAPLSHTNPSGTSTEVHHTVSIHSLSPNYLPSSTH